MDRISKQTLLQRENIDGNKHMKRCSILLSIREMEIKTSVRYHITLIRIAIIKKKNLQLINGHNEEVPPALLVGM